MSNQQQQGQQVDAVKLIAVLQDKLRIREDENSLLLARLMMAEEELKKLREQELPQTDKGDTVDVSPERLEKRVDE